MPTQGEPVIQYSILCQRSHSPEPDNIGHRRSQVMVVLFGGQGTNSLATMRYIFRKKVVYASSFVTTGRLLSTECVTKVHFRRVYYQVIDWVITVSKVSKLFVSTIYTPFWLFIHRCDFWKMISSDIPDTTIRLRMFCTRRRRRNAWLVRHNTGYEIFIIA